MRDGSALSTEWWRSAVSCHVYPRSFADSNSNGDGIRDLPGITGRLSYLADLCVDAVWLSPCFASPMADSGYAVADHCSVDPVFGTPADFESLVQRLMDGRLRVLIDFVGNESDEHELAALDGCPPRSDGTGVRLSAATSTRLSTKCFLGMAARDRESVSRPVSG
jgi:alpha-glucosidase